MHLILAVFEKIQIQCIKRDNSKCIVKKWPGELSITVSAGEGVHVTLEQTLPTLSPYQTPHRLRVEEVSYAD